MLRDKGGIPAIRRLVNAGTDPEQVLSEAADILGVLLRDLDELWRRRRTRHRHDPDSALIFSSFKPGGATCLIRGARVRMLGVRSRGGAGAECAGR
jgi:hypothetical protein